MSKEELISMTITTDTSLQTLCENSSGQSSCQSMYCSDCRYEDVAENRAWLENKKIEYKLKMMEL